MPVGRAATLPTIGSPLNVVKVIRQFCRPMVVERLTCKVAHASKCAKTRGPFALHAWPRRPSLTDSWRSSTCQFRAGGDGDRRAHDPRTSFAWTGRH